MNLASQFPEVLKFFISGAIFFVWIIRYENIVREFKYFKYPQWLRDFVGVLKVSFAIMLLQDQEQYIAIAAAGISILMLFAFLTHIKVKNSLLQMLPSVTLLLLSLLVLKNNISL